MRRRYFTLASGSLLGIVMAYNSCAYYRPHDGKTSTLGNPMREEKTAFGISKYQNVTALNICLSKMVFMQVSGETVTLPILPPQTITVPENGIDMDTLLVAQGEYSKINLELEDACGSNSSLSFTNAQGSFKIAAAVTLKFSGNEFIGGDQRKIVFDVQALAAQLKSVQSDSMVVATAAGTLGDYHSQNCGMQSNSESVAFCETFDKPMANNGRAGQLDSLLWNVSRIGGASNLGQGQYDIWSKSTVDACGTSQAAAPDGSDVIVCNGQLREVSDGMSLTALTMSPRQAFDFAGRTGTVAFDVTNDTTGSSGVWPEFWLSDQSLAGNLWVSSGIKAMSKNAIVIRMGGNFQPFVGNVAPGCPSDDHKRWIVDSISLIKDYAVQDIVWFGNDVRLQPTGCVIASDGSSGKMNHMEIRASQNQIEVWATDAGSPVLKKIAVMQNLSLPFSKGYVSLGDYHRGAGADSNHTFAWDNVAFDGPVMHRDLGFDVANAMVVIDGNTFGLGWQSNPGSPVSLSTASLTAAQVAAAVATGAGAKLTLNFNVPVGVLTNFQYSVNGVPLNAVIPFTTKQYETYSIELPVPATALMPGTQALTIMANDYLIFANVSLKLPGAGN